MVSRRQFLKSIMAWLGLVLTGCGRSGYASSSATAVPDTQSPSTPTLTPTAVPTSTAIPTPTPTPTPVPTSTPAPLVTPPPGGIPYYTFSIVLDYAGRQMEVEERILLYNDTPDAWNEVVLSVPSAYTQGIFNLRLVSLTTAREQTLATPEWDVTMLHIPLPIPLLPGEPLEINLGFALNLPAVEPTAWPPVGNFGWSERLIQMGDWHPTVVPYDAEQGWRTWTYQPVGDPVIYGVGHYDVRMITDEDIVVAAPGFINQEGTLRRYHLDYARAFAFLVSPEYQVLQDQSVGIPVTSYFLPDYAEAGQAVLDTACQAVALYSELYGAFPYPSLSLAQNGYYGAMEYSGMISMTGYGYDTYTGEPSDLLVLLTAHEVAHQWWYGAVGNDQVHEPWLDESFAKYSELLFCERYVPHLMDWWWEQSVYYWDPSGPLDNTIYDYPDTATYIHMIYGQGARFMADLRAAMGDKAFFEFVRYYQSAGRNRLVTRSDFLDAARSHTDVDLSELFARYLVKLES